MVLPDKKRLNAIYDYLSTDDRPYRPADGAFVFGMIEPRTAEKAARLYHDGLVKYIMVTGGVGSGSGYLAKLNAPEIPPMGTAPRVAPVEGVREAHWQALLMHAVHGVPESAIYTEPNARNGAQNCEFGIDLIVNNQLEHANLVLVCHGSYLRRGAAVFGLKARAKNFSTNTQRARVDFPFDWSNNYDQKIVTEELLRVADWPNHQPDMWADPQSDLPQDLVQYARDLKASWK